MLDLVIVVLGQMFERVYIQYWIGEGYLLCLKIQQYFFYRSLILNYIVKVLIVNWCEMYDVFILGFVQLKLYMVNLQLLFFSGVVRLDLDLELFSLMGLMLGSVFGCGGRLMLVLCGVGRMRKFLWLISFCGIGEVLVERVRSVSLGGDEGGFFYSGCSFLGGGFGELEVQNFLSRFLSGYVVEYLFLYLYL